MPVVPDLANECLNNLDYKVNIEWPEALSKYLKNEKLELVIQINGKKKHTIEVEENIDEKEVTNRIKESGLIAKYIDNKVLIRTVLVKNRLINNILK